MELTYSNSNTEIVLAKKMNSLKLFFLRNFENWNKKQIQNIIFLETYSKCPQNKKIYNFYITNQNGMIKVFLYRQEYNL